MAESDEWATVETVPDGIINEESTPKAAYGPSGISPGILSQVMQIITTTNPWIILIIAIILYVIWQKLQIWLPSFGSSSEHGPSLSPEEILAKQEALERARRRMQEEYEQKAREYAAKQKEKEELARQEKLKNLEKYGSKLGKSTKLLAAEEPSQELQAGLAKKKSEKPKLRPEYNPLMGDSSAGVCFRPTRRGGAGGG